MPAFRMLFCDHDVASEILTNIVFTILLTPYGGASLTDSYPSILLFWVSDSQYMQLKSSMANS